MTKFVTDESGVVMSYEQWQKLHPTQTEDTYSPIQRNPKSIFPTKASNISTPIPTRKKKYKKMNLTELINDEVQRKLDRMLATCSICRLQVRFSRLESHLKKVHQNKNQGDSNSSKGVTKTTKDTTINSSEVIKETKTYVHCNICGVTVRSTRLQSHIKKAHYRDRNSRRSLEDKSMNKKFHTTTHSSRNTHYSENDTMDGGKYLGQLRRDINGQYGSLPLYDDYSEGSNAD